MKRITIILTLIILLLFVCCSFESDRIDLSDDSFYAFYMGETPSNAPPASTDGYIFDHADCTNGASLTWDNNTWSATVNGLTTTRTKCTLYFALDNHTNLVIARLAGNADPTSTALIDNGTDASGCTNTLAYDDFGNLRFVGANPCNYVTFNGETAGWRIIGIIDNRVKLIRNEFIGSYSWDTSASEVNGGGGINQWGESGSYTGADLMKLLNPGFNTNLAEDSSGNQISGTYVNNSLYWNGQSGNCYNKYNNAYTTCDFTSTGLSSEAKSMIASTTWHLGSQGSNDYTASGLGTSKKFYEYERSSNTGKICTSGSFCDDKVARTTEWEGYIGLMSPSDYGYAVGGSVRNTCLSKSLRNYNTDNCVSNDWLHKGTYEWMMSPHADSTYARDVFYVDNTGHVYSPTVGYAYASRPALNLISGVKVSSGNGSSNNPYVLSLN